MVYLSFCYKNHSILNLKPQNELYFTKMEFFYQDVWKFVLLALHLQW